MATLEEDDAAGAPPRLQPCGRETCGCSDISPRVEPPVRPDAEKLEKLAALDTEAAVAWERRCDELDDRLLHHEASHAILDCASGRGIKFVQLTGSSGVCVAAQGGGRGWIMGMLAGEIGGGIARRCILPPFKEEILAYIAKVRRGDEDCGCDEFRLARFFVGLQNEDDDGIVDIWIRQWRRCVELLADRIEGRIALARLTSELKKRRHMTGEEVEAVLDVEGLRAAFAEVFPA
jgi:hypothetical protein